MLLVSCSKVEKVSYTITDQNGDNIFSNSFNCSEIVEAPLTITSHSYGPNFSQTVSCTHLIQNNEIYIDVEINLLKRKIKIEEDLQNYKLGQGYLLNINELE